VYQLAQVVTATESSNFSSRLNTGNEGAFCVDQTNCSTHEDEDRRHRMHGRLW